MKDNIAYLYVFMYNNAAYNIKAIVFYLYNMYITL